MLVTTKTQQNGRNRHSLNPPFTIVPDRCWPCEPVSRRLQRKALSKQARHEHRSQPTFCAFQAQKISSVCQHCERAVFDGANRPERGDPSCSWIRRSYSGGCGSMRHTRQQRTCCFDWSGVHRPPSPLLRRLPCTASASPSGPFPATKRHSIHNQQGSSHTGRA